MTQSELKTFKDLQIESEKEPFFRCDRARMNFANGFGVSVIRGNYTYGGRHGLWEVAVLKNDEIVYDTPIADDVIGSCTEEDVTNIMKQVQELSSEEES